MSNDDEREKIKRLEAEIERLAGAIELGRKVIPIAQVAVIAAGALIVAITIGAIGFDPMAVIGGTIPLIVGIIFLAWRRRRLDLMASVLQIAKAHSAELVDKIDPSKPNK
jgi:hypothetical protein